METPMFAFRLLSGVGLCLVSALAAFGGESNSGPGQKLKASLTNYFSPPESQGGWRSLLPQKSDPDADGKARIRKTASVDWDKLEEAWKYNAAAEGASGLLVIRHGMIVGEWYKGCGRNKTF